MIREGAALSPRSPALSFFLTTEDHTSPEVYSYETLLARIHQTANAFHALGATKDTIIAYILPNVPEAHFVIWGGQAAGIVFAINPLLAPHTIAELLTVAKASMVVTLAPFPKIDLWHTLHDAIRQVASLRHVVLVDVAPHVRGVKRVVARALRRVEMLRAHGLAGSSGAVGKPVHDYAALIARQPSDRLVSGRVIDAEDLSSFFCTGGTTGVPKIAMRCHRNEVNNAWSARQFLGAGMGAGKNVYCGLPLFHVNAVMATGLVPFSRGAHVVLGTPQGYRGPGVVKRFWEIVEHHRIHFFSGVPTLYSSLLEVPLAGRDVSSLEFGLCGAAPMPLQVMHDFQQRTGLRIVEGYGLTEATCVSSLNPPLAEPRVGSIGVRVPGQLMKTVMLDEHGIYLRECAVDEVGVIVVSGPNVFNGYLVPQQNVGLFFEQQGRRWLNTGDLGRCDADGYFSITGRKKELIIRGGHNIDPAAIEEPLHRHHAVHLAAAIGRPDAHAGELPVAYVQLKAGATATEADLLGYLRDSISEPAALPKQVRIVAEMPLTPIGKIWKPALRKLEIASALGAALEKAKVVVEALEVVDDAARGLLVKVRAEDVSAAERVLGSYPIPFVVN